jgi:hypothetical protein
MFIPFRASFSAVANPNPLDPPKIIAHKPGDGAFLLTSEFFKLLYV